MSAKKKLPGIEFLRFFFMVWICLIHIWKPFNLYHGAIGVEFFFLVSGYFLFQGYRNKPVSVLSFGRKRFARLFPAYFVGILLSYAIFILDSVHDGSGIDGIRLAGDFVTESLMIQDLGWFSLNPVNPVSWYVSVLFIASILLYAALRFHERFSLLVLFPALIVGYYVLTASHGLQVTEIFGADAANSIGPVFLPLGRGLAAISAGILIGAILEKAEFGKKGSLGLDILSALSFCLITVYLFLPYDNDYLMLLPMVLLVLAACQPDSWLNRLFTHPVWSFLGSLTYGMLMLHIPVRYLVNYGYGLYPHFRMAWILVYLTVTILAAWGLNKLLEAVRPKVQG